MSRKKQLAWGLLTSVLVLGLVEAGLRAAHFRYDTFPRYMQFGYPDAEALVDVFEPDPVLFWRLIPGKLYWPDHIPVSRQGYRGWGFEASKPPGMFRVVALGDSCSFLGRKSYPELLEGRLRLAFPGRSFEVLNLAVPGYSSWQGRRLLETRALALRPDLVLIYFGWNDHWDYRSVPDKLQKSPQQRALVVRGALMHLRLFQLESLLVAKVRQTLAPPPPKTPGDEICRVSLPDYRENLRAMIREVRRQGGEVILITAATGAKTGAELAPYLVAEHMIPEGNWALARHWEYVAATREVAAAEHVPLVDAALELERREDPRIFWRDNIHLTDYGLELLAQMVFERSQDWVKTKWERQ